MILTSWFTRGHWRETWAVLALVVWYCIGFVQAIQFLLWLAWKIPTPPAVFGA